MPAFLGTMLGGGAALGIGGSFLESSGKKKEAHRQRVLLEDAAKKRKLNFSEEMEGALGDLEQFGPRAAGVAETTSLADQDILDLLREKGAPGSGKRRDKLLEIIDSFLAGELSEETQRGISRSSAAQGAARFGNLGGSIPLRAEAAALGRATEEQQARGFAALGQFNSLFPTAQPVSVMNFLGPTPTQRIGIRSQEQSDVANILSRRGATPSSRTGLGSMMSGLGGEMMGLGMMGQASKKFPAMFGGGGRDQGPFFGPGYGPGQ